MAAKRKKYFIFMTLFSYDFVFFSSSMTPSIVVFSMGCLGKSDRGSGWFFNDLNQFHYPKNSSRSPI